MRIGFTGTRHGMTDVQLQAFDEWLCSQPDVSEFHHGDCVGADDEAANDIHEIAHGEDPGPPIKVVCHPPVDESHRANNSHYDEVLPPLTHFARNRAIVDGTDILVACPGSMEEQQFGGTWYTIRYARKKDKPIVIVWPNGTLTTENGATP